MSEVIQLLPEPDPERDGAIFADWRRGKKSIVQLAREHGLPQSQITHILDQHLPQLTPKAQVRELRKLLFDLEELRVAYHAIATKENDPEAANVSIRTAHEIAQLRMFVGGSAHHDPVQLEKAAKPGGTSTESWIRALEHLRADPDTSPETKARIEAIQPEKKPPEDQEDPEPDQEQSA